MNQNNISLEKVVKELARIREDHFGGMTSYEGEALDVALALLKTQEPVEPKVIVYHILSDGTCDFSPRMVTCGACGEWLIENSDVIPRYKYCPQCGRKVKWE